MVPERACHAWRQTVAAVGRWKAVEVDDPVLSLEDLRWLWRVVRRAWDRVLLRSLGVRRGARRHAGW
ncbi:MAG TPA: hypothetical protein VNL35_12275 [Chloroflexota bacterium]|nr:hypothetical protein [Chloroflexota bacterium]